MIMIISKTVKNKGEVMNPNICNNCGGDYEHRNGRWRCRACGAYKPETLSNEEVTLLYTAYQKLRFAEFLEAEKEFDDILTKYPKNASAYWGRLMAKYGIKYEKDFDGRMIPTCYATSIESLLSTQDYQKAIQYADNENKTYYQQQAEYMERVRKEWLEKAKKEKPYDIFICYKESDLANGIGRTQDSIAAQDLYIHLTNKGYRVFYSHESLRDKVGEKYEPYIFNALSTAKVMIVYGSKPEYITSTWLKNEWTRYEKRLQKGEKKPNSLLVAYESFSPNELPTALSSMQCLNAGEKSFYSNLDDMIERILYGETAAEKYEKKKKRKGPVIAIALLLFAAIGGALSLLLFNDSKPEACEHISITVEGSPSTCTENGLTEGAYCIVCNEVLVKQQTIPASHTPGDAADCIHGQKCTVCGDELKAALGHTPGAEATCTTAQSCTICKAELKSALGHTPGAEATCKAAQKCTVCKEELHATLAHTAGDWETVTEATATQNGLKVKKCSACGDVLEEEAIPAIGHLDLKFTRNSDGTYSVSGIGSCKDTDILIPVTYQGAQVTDITKYAFENCTGLTSIVIPNTISNIGLAAFRNSSLTSIVIGTGVERIEEQAFYGCSNLTSISVDSNNPNYGSIDGILFNKGTMELICYPAGKTETSYTIPTAITAIGKDAFHGCKNLTSIVITGGVKNIGDAAFRDCNNLKNVEIRVGLESIGSTVFWDCVSLTNIVIPDSVISIESQAFRGCSSLSTIEFPESVTSLGETLFWNCTALTNVKLPDGLTNIPSNIFNGCSNLSSIKIPESVTVIGSAAFYNCTALTSIALPNGLKEIGYSAFRECTSLTSIVIPESVTIIDTDAFSNCLSLTSLQYSGTIAQWNAITKYSNWNGWNLSEIICSDGKVSLK